MPGGRRQSGINGRRRSGPGMVAKVAHQPEDILGNKAANGTARIDADDDLAGRVEDKPGGLEVDRVGLTNASVRPAMAAASALCPSGKVRPCSEMNFGVTCSSSTHRAATWTPASAREPRAR